MAFTGIAYLAFILLAAASEAQFDSLQHLGGNSPWFQYQAPNVNDVSADVPPGCVVDQAVYAVRHGSRYPDPSAYSGWVSLYDKFQNATYNASGSLSFLPQWQPVLSYPAQQLSQESVGGYKELADLGANLRFRYPTFYYPAAPRVIDSARLFTRGYMGPNSTLYGSVYVVKSTASGSVGNSLGTSDSCPTFLDSSGGTNATGYDSLYLPPITARLNGLLQGNLTLVDSDVSNFPYLCGFESQITGRVSPWCGVFEENELLQYEYRQDLRYYYGTGPGALKNSSVQYPLLQGIVELLQAGPNVTAAATNGSTFTLPPLVMAFTNDGQINEVASITGVFGQQPPLDSAALDPDPNRLYISSHITPMRGTVAFERLTCGSQVSSSNNTFSFNNRDVPSGNNTTSTFIRILLNDAVFRSFADVCGLTSGNLNVGPSGGVTFFRNLSQPSFIYEVEP
ncbi:hypothetical protein MMC10_008756 [Thelotrema lepadinum]|nr:hypothetical protein [Thelotrema lepadinum]